MDGNNSAGLRDRDACRYVTIPPEHVTRCDQRNVADDIGVSGFGRAKCFHDWPCGIEARLCALSGSVVQQKVFIARSGPRAKRRPSARTRCICAGGSGGGGGGET